VAPVEDLVPLVAGLTMEMINSAEGGNMEDAVRARDIVIAYGADCTLQMCAANPAISPVCPAITAMMG